MCKTGESRRRFSRQKIKLNKNITGINNNMNSFHKSMNCIPEVLQRQIYLMRISLLMKNHLGNVHNELLNTKPFISLNLTTDLFGFETDYEFVERIPKLIK